MKHIILLSIRTFLVLCGVIALNVKAGVVFFEDFEKGWGSWSADNGIWEVGTPMAGAENCYDGSQCAGTVLDGNYPEKTNSRLISPSIILPKISSKQELHLRFWHLFLYKTNAFRSIQISTFSENTDQWSEWQSLYDSKDENSGGGGLSPVWSLFNINISSYNDKKVKIAFYHTNTWIYAHTGWHIDNVEIKTDAPIQTYSEDCIATYQLDGNLHIPCVTVPNGFGGTITYEADMRLLPFTRPFKFELTNAQPK